MEIRTSGFFQHVGNGSGCKGAKNWVVLHITVDPQFVLKEGKFANFRVE